MFEALETGKQLKAPEFRAEREMLRPALLAAQFDLRTRSYPVIVLVAGFDGSGKGAVMHRLNAWMDPRYIESHAFWTHSDEETERPWFWRFWRRMPARGSMGVMMGGWYEEPLEQALQGQLDEHALNARLQEIRTLERMLSEDGAVIVKLWLHVSRKRQRKLLKEEAPHGVLRGRIAADSQRWAKCHSRALDLAERMIRLTDSGHAPWHLIEAECPNWRDIHCGRLLREAMAAAQTRQSAPSQAARAADSSAEADSAASAGQPTLLDRVDLSTTVNRAQYRKRIDTLQSRLQALAWNMHRRKRSFIAVFEGWDAAGKGSAIRRVTEAIDPRLYRLVQFAAPTDEERAHHYLWRFWRQLQRDGQATLYDRSWYGRVLVERVEGYASTDAWRRAYSEINLFEQQLTAHGSVLCKFWLHISPEEQLRRFEDRAATPHKQHKITEEDWRNRARWDDYAHAVEDMIAGTSTRHAPWTLVAGNCKLHARLHILETLCERLAQALDD